MKEELRISGILTQLSVNGGLLTRELTGKSDKEKEQNRLTGLNYKKIKINYNSDEIQFFGNHFCLSQEGISWSSRSSSLAIGSVITSFIPMSTAFLACSIQNPFLTSSINNFKEISRCAK